MAHADPAKEPIVSALCGGPPVPVSPRSHVTEALRTGKSAIVPHVSESYVEAISQSAERHRLLLALGFRSLLTVPLVARGQPLGAITFVFGDSGRRHDRRDLAVAEDLAGRAALAADNARLYRQAQDAIRARDAFLASASHDLRTPLSYIKGTAAVLRLLAGSADPRRIEDGLAIIETSATRMAGLIDELLDVAQLQMGRELQLHRAPTDLVKLVRAAVERRQQLATAHRLAVDAAAETLVGAWDAMRIERVLDNLLDNAIKYSPRGGQISVSVGRADLEDDWAVLAVQDRGLGIPAGDLPRIFERFHRGENVQGRFAGTGLGLAGCRQVVEQHGGTIEVESDEGVGSTFTARLPLSPALARRPGSESAWP
jgi:signal transduction histidine kinase